MQPFFFVPDTTRKKIFFTLLGICVKANFSIPQEAQPFFWGVLLGNSVEPLQKCNQFFLYQVLLKDIYFLHYLEVVWRRISKSLERCHHFLGTYYLEIVWNPLRNATIFLDTAWDIFPPHYLILKISVKTLCKPPRAASISWDVPFENRLEINPFDTAVPIWGQISLIPSDLSPKRDWGPKRVKKCNNFFGHCFR